MHKIFPRCVRHTEPDIVINDKGKWVMLALANDGLGIRIMSYVLVRTAFVFVSYSELLQVPWSDKHTRLHILSPKILNLGNTKSAFCNIFFIAVALLVLL